MSKNHIFSIIKSDGPTLGTQLSKVYREDHDKFLWYFDKYPAAYESCSDDIKDDMGVISLAIKKHAHNIRHVPENKKNNTLFVII